LRKALALSAGAALVGAIAGTIVGRQTAESERRTAAAQDAAASSEFGRWLAERISEAESVEISYGHGVGSPTVRFSDRSWIARYGKILATSHYEPRAPCLCVTFPAVHFIRDGERVATMTLHHGVTIRVSTVTRGIRDFYVGDAVVRDLSMLVWERSNEAQSPEATP